MKVTIAQLQERIESLEGQKNLLYEKWLELDEADKKRKELKMARFDEEQRQTDKQVLNLLEIIRWQVNPKTAESPFMPTKSERDDGRRNY